MESKLSGAQRQFMSGKPDNIEKKKKYKDNQKLYQK
jgi:hypothetical protein